MLMSDEQEIRQLVAQWMAATKAGDTETVLSLMTDDVVFLVAGQPPMIGKDAFRAALAQQGSVQFEGHSEIQEVQVLGDWAYMWTRLTVIVHRNEGAPPITRAGHTLSVLKRVDGQWLLARDANMLVTR
jgi:uncharacterized protein (TIGR02246 family)